VIVVTFPNVPEAITDGRGEIDALREAADALGVALLSCPLRGLPLPKPRARSGPAITVVPEVAAKLAVLEAFSAAGISKSELARRLRVSENEARRILDPMHATKLPRLSEALTVLGRRLVVGVEEIASAAWIKMRRMPRRRSRQRSISSRAPTSDA
jgi:antitoxin HicB